MGSRLSARTSARASGSIVLASSGRSPSGFAEHVVSHVAGVPDAFACRAFPPSCEAHDCSCFAGDAGVGSTCAAGGVPVGGEFTVTLDVG